MPVRETLQQLPDACDVAAAAADVGDAAAPDDVRGSDAAVATDDDDDDVVVVVVVTHTIVHAPVGSDLAAHVARVAARAGPVYAAAGGAVVVADLATGGAIVVADRAADFVAAAAYVVAPVTVATTVNARVRVQVLDPFVSCKSYLKDH
ncbi:hypothetical protein L1987_78712 [Smallanthus sonchifolius]|uniref:Uncharacterized protein n=1 Tax=Smallanthus sonchifolius TaxID=185202 RepID=A0ACB8ZDN5_9ASTR|nr:hypothetical protein L1987_78712 [Smallanthus sonchifolius]